MHRYTVTALLLLVTVLAIGIGAMNYFVQFVPLHSHEPAAIHADNITIEGDGTSSDPLEIEQPYRLPQTCALGEVASWNGSIWECDAAPTPAVHADNITIEGDGTSSDPLEIEPPYRLPQTCARHEVATWSGSAWECDDQGTAPVLSVARVSGPIAVDPNPDPDALTNTVNYYSAWTDTGVNVGVNLAAYSVSQATVSRTSASGNLPTGRQAAGDITQGKHGPTWVVVEDLGRVMAGDDATKSTCQGDQGSSVDLGGSPQALCLARTAAGTLAVAANLEIAGNQGDNALSVSDIVIRVYHDVAARPIRSVARIEGPITMDPPDVAGDYYSAWTDTGVNVGVNLAAYSVSQATVSRTSASGNLPTGRQAAGDITQGSHGPAWVVVEDLGRVSVGDAATESTCQRDQGSSVNLGGSPQALCLARTAAGTLAVATYMSTSRGSPDNVLTVSNVTIRVYHW